MSFIDIAPADKATEGRVPGPATAGAARAIPRSTVPTETSAAAPRTCLTESLAYPPLPQAPSAINTRRVGIEIEFGGLSPEEAARCAAAAVHGSAAPLGPAEWHVPNSDCGALDIYLDTKFRPQSAGFLADAVISLGRSVIPVEVVTEPRPQADLPVMESMLSALTARGAKGSGDGLAWSFGLHLNVELADPKSGADLPPVALAFALLEPWLRARDPMDFSRRILPFASTFPDGFVDEMAHAGPEMDMDTFVGIVGRHIASRNHGLDLLPAIAAVRPDEFQHYYPGNTTVKPRPAFHYRMPDSRLGTPGWSLAYEWRRWVLIERVARAPHLLATLCEVWEDYMGFDASREDALIYHSEVTRLLGAQAMLAPAGGGTRVV
ncbi:amidoligase family protein [Chachezhania sediminis]|uniref:amidoligase family protein n=1 Tax=Chachezhania sediminis TaxID=2599291 RepID=UPI00131D95C1|nr:amidoligase family protein [Chachezhania sediminis]